MNIATETIETKFQALLEEGQEGLAKSGSLCTSRKSYRGEQAIEPIRYRCR